MAGGGGAEAGGYGAEWGGTGWGGRPWGTGLSSLLYIGCQGTLYRGEGGSFLRTGETVRAKEVEGSPRAGIQGEGRSLDMLSHVQEFVQSVCVPHQPGAPPSLRYDSPNLCHESGPREPQGGEPREWE